VSVLVVVLGAVIGLAPFVLGLPLVGLTKYALPGAIVVAAIAAGALTRWQAGRKRQRIFGVRTPIPPESIFADYGAAAGIDRERFLRNWTECARCLKVPPDRLRPTDRFKIELAPVGFFDGIGHELDDLFDFALRECPHDHDAANRLRRVETLGDLVCYLSESRPHRQHPL
jgi:hypothetical protein